MAIQGDPLIDVDPQLEFDKMASAAITRVFIAGVLTPQSSRLEPTLGQIWPR